MTLTMVRTHLGAPHLIHRSEVLTRFWLWVKRQKLIPDVVRSPRGLMEPLSLLHESSIVGSAPSAGRCPPSRLSEKRG